jgi:hypothetical protein
VHKIERRWHPYSDCKVSACMCMYRRELDMSKDCTDVTKEEEKLRPTCIYPLGVDASVRKPHLVEITSV